MQRKPIKTSTKVSTVKKVPESSKKSEKEEEKKPIGKKLTSEKSKILVSSKKKSEKPQELETKKLDKKRVVQDIFGVRKFSSNNYITP